MDNKTFEKATMLMERISDTQEELDILKKQGLTIFIGDHLKVDPNDEIVKKCEAITMMMLQDRLFKLQDEFREL